ncbi:hypothetical protein [Nonomuraea sp. NPDC046570]|uniref:hypothetical protein n=1 Tax=Nonomuraea sp. NPDC046570 TaxID=3155255 RepID=UPI0033CE53A3
MEGHVTTSVSGRGAASRIVWSRSTRTSERRWWRVVAPAVQDGHAGQAAGGAQRVRHGHADLLAELGGDEGGDRPGTGTSIPVSR